MIGILDSKTSGIPHVLRDYEERNFLRYSWAVLFLTLHAITGTFLSVNNRFGAERLKMKPPDSMLMMEVFVFLLGLHIDEVSDDWLGGLGSNMIKINTNNMEGLGKFKKISQ